MSGWRCFAELGAAPDVARVELGSGAPPATVSGLTVREAEVLRLVAAGLTNRAIARRRVGRDARYVTKHIAAHRPAVERPAARPEPAVAGASGRLSP